MSNESVNLKEYSNSDLQKLLAKIQKEIRTRETKNAESVKREIERIAKSAGVDLGALFPRQKAAAPKAEKAAKKQGKPAGKKGLAKYRNPDDPSKTWTGHGRQPTWVIDHLQAGGSLDDLKIRGKKKTDATNEPQPESTEQAEQQAQTQAPETQAQTQEGQE